MKKGIKKTICILLTAISCISLVGCGEAAVGQADINPQTPIEEVAFPLSETKELSFITNAPARTEQDPNKRTIFMRLEEQTNVHVNWTCFVSDQFGDK